MSNRIVWAPSTSPAIASYDVENAAVFTGPWTLTANVVHAIPGPNYDPLSGTFFYDDAVNPGSTWYRVTAIDSLNQRSVPSVAFQTAGTLSDNFAPGMTPFGIFDADPAFQHDADLIADYVRKKLGEPVMVVHLSSSQIYAAFEEACLEYSAVVNSYQAKSVLATMLGAATGTLSGSENKFPMKSLSLAFNASDPFGTEAEVDSSVPLYTGSIQTTVGVQDYDIPRMLFDTGQWDGTGTIVVRDLYHKSPSAAYRFFGTTSGLNYLNNQFRFESFTPETLFYLLPIWEDVLRGMQFKTSQNVRRSHYSFDIHDGKLRLYPMAQDSLPLHFRYSVVRDSTAVTTTYLSASASGSQYNPGYNGVANLSNIPFGNIQYSQINSISRHWIRRMAMAFSKEIEGQIRSKFATVPIPNGDVTLNGPELITDARADMDALRNELKEILEETTYQKLMEKEAAAATQLQETWKGVPLGIYIG